jgi:hypothetical protein
MDRDPIAEQQKREKRRRAALARARARKAKGQKVAPPPPPYSAKGKAGKRKRASEQAEREKIQSNSQLPAIQGHGGHGGPPGDARVELPRYQPNEADSLRIAVWRANGYTGEAISRLLGWPEDTLAAAYPMTWHHGFEMVSGLIAEKVTMGAIGGDQKDQHFYLRSRAGWGGAHTPTAAGALNADRALEAVALVGKAAVAAASRGGIPPPGPNGKVKLTISIGIAGDRRGADAEDDDGDEGDPEEEGTAAASEGG